MRPGDLDHRAKGDLHDLILAPAFGADLAVLVVATTPLTLLDPLPHVPGVDELDATVGRVRDGSDPARLRRPPVPGDERPVPGTCHHVHHRLRPLDRGRRVQPRQEILVVLDEGDVRPQGTVFLVREGPNRHAELFFEPGEDGERVAPREPGRVAVRGAAGLHEPGVGAVEALPGPPAQPPGFGEHRAELADRDQRSDEEPAAENRGLTEAGGRRRDGRCLCRGHDAEVVGDEDATAVRVKPDLATVVVEVLLRLVRHLLEPQVALEVHAPGSDSRSLEPRRQVRRLGPLGRRGGDPDLAPGDVPLPLPVPEEDEVRVLGVRNDVDPARPVLREAGPERGDHLTKPLAARRHHLRVVSGLEIGLVHDGAHRAGDELVVEAPPLPDEFESVEREDVFRPLRQRAGRVEVADPGVEDPRGPRVPLDPVAEEDGRRTSVDRPEEPTLGELLANLSEDERVQPEDVGVAREEVRGRVHVVLGEEGLEPRPVRAAVVADVTGEAELLQDRIQPGHVPGRFRLVHRLKLAARGLQLLGREARDGDGVVVAKEKPPEGRLGGRVIGHGNLHRGRASSGHRFPPDG